jgi:hypothetical protein
LEGIVDHGTVVDREEVLVRDPGERIEPRAETAGKDDPLHDGETLPDDPRDVNRRPR